MCAGAACAGLVEDEQGNPLQVRDVVALLRKADDPDALERGLSALGPLLHAQPDELHLRAGAVWRCGGHAHRRCPPRDVRGLFASGRKSSDSLPF